MSFKGTDNRLTGASMEIQSLLKPWMVSLEDTRGPKKKWDFHINYKILSCLFLFTHIFT